MNPPEARSQGCLVNVLQLIPVLFQNQHRGACTDLLRAARQDLLRHDASQRSPHQRTSLTGTQQLTCWCRKNELDQVLIEIGIAGLFECRDWRGKLGQLARHEPDTTDM